MFQGLWCILTRNIPARLKGKLKISDLFRDSSDRADVREGTQLNNCAAFCLQIFDQNQYCAQVLTIKQNISRFSLESKKKKPQLSYTKYLTTCAPGSIISALKSLPKSKVLEFKLDVKTCLHTHTANAPLTDSLSLPPPQSPPLSVQPLFLSQ